MTGLPRDCHLPVFPWDTLAGARARAQSYPGGFVDLSVGSPVDDVPSCATRALREADNAHSYPTVIGSQELRQTIAAWCQSQRNASFVTSSHCFPTIGSKELVANIGWQLGLEPHDVVCYPRVAYPTYEICALVAHAQPCPVSDDVSSWPSSAKIVWINSPSNPRGSVLSINQLREMVAWARAHDAVLISDECYAPLAWQEPWKSQGVPSLLDDRVCEGDLSRLLMVYSASKQSNLAGYRASFIAGDRQLITHLIGVRKHCGFMVPTPVQAALKQVLSDETHVKSQYERYSRRRNLLIDALQTYGLVIDPQCVAGLYLWTTMTHEDRCRLDSHQGTNIGRYLVEKLSRHGILVAPGEFYGDFSQDYVRIALTADDDSIACAAQRLKEVKPLS